MNEKDDQANVGTVQTMPPLVGVLLGALALALGVWVMQMGFDGRTPAEELEPREVPGMIGFGAVFCWGGFQTIVLCTIGHRLSRWGHILLFSVFIVCLAVPFILSGVLTPDQITSSVSVGGNTMHQSEGHPSGAYVFIGFGVALIIGLPFLVRMFFPKNGKAGESRHEVRPE